MQFFTHKHFKQTHMSTTDKTIALQTRTEQLYCMSYMYIYKYFTSSIKINTLEIRCIMSFYHKASL